MCVCAGSVNRVLSISVCCSRGSCPAAGTCEYRSSGSLTRCWPAGRPRAAALPLPPPACSPSSAPAPPRPPPAPPQYEILARTADGDEGGRHQLIAATVSNGNLYLIKVQVGDKRWFKGAKKEAIGAWNSFTVV